MAPKQREISTGVRQMVVKCYQGGKIQCEFTRIFGVPRASSKSNLKKYRV